MTTTTLRTTRTTTLTTLRCRTALRRTGVGQLSGVRLPAADAAPVATRPIEETGSGTGTSVANHAGKATGSTVAAAVALTGKIGKPDARGGSRPANETSNAAATDTAANRPLHAVVSVRAHNGPQEVYDRPVPASKAGQHAQVSGFVLVGAVATQRHVGATNITIPTSGTIGQGQDPAAATNATTGRHALLARGANHAIPGHAVTAAQCHQCTGRRHTQPVPKKTTAPWERRIDNWVQLQPRASKKMNGSASPCIRRSP